ncbi:TetR/AcrR family transcriptional regulator [Paenarthrobacter nicotinovorans]|uniref:TetR/AcrR family transcriptional regulator n=1 Tax=Paenarthrobacter nicotinovorans TaxID=29320 RepID=UPI00374937FC
MPRIKARNLDAHRELMRGALLDAFDSLVSERDFDSVTLSDVAGRAGMARNTIYNYAQDKNELAAIAAARASKDLVARITDIVASDQEAPARLEAMLRLLLNALAAGPTRVALSREISRADARLMAPYVEVHSLIQQVIIEGVKSGDFCSVGDPETTVHLLAGAAAAAAARIVAGGDAPRYADAMAELALRSLRP